MKGRDIHALIEEIRSPDNASGYDFRVAARRLADAYEKLERENAVQRERNADLTAVALRRSERIDELLAELERWQTGAVFDRRPA